VRTVVVTGAAGALGQRVVSRLAALPDTKLVVAVDRVAMAAPAPKVESRCVDLTDGQAPQALAEVCRQADALVHLAWAAPEDHHVPGANLVALERVLAAAADGNVGQVVHLSSATVYGAWSDNPVPLGEDAALRPNAELVFAVEKAEAERRVAEWAASHPQASLAVLRPAVTVGSVERPLYQALGGTRRPAAERSNRPVQYLHLDDLASAVVHVCQQGLSGVFNVAPDHGISEDTARALAGGLARVTLPGRLANAVSRWTWRLWRWGAPAEAQAYAEHPWVVAGDRLVQTGWRPEYTSEEALVAADGRAHWEDLPASRRQRLALGIAGGALTGLAGGVAGVLSWRRRRRRSGDRGA
jgi:nucleoside-diphosphate-sugar epimerase